MTRTAMKLLVAVCLTLLMLDTAARAHSQSFGYLAVNGDALAVEGTLALAARDLDLISPLDADGDGAITWGEVRLNEAAIAAAALAKVALASDAGRCTLAGDPMLTDQRGGETYIVVPFRAACPPAAGELLVTYNALFDIDAQHRGLVTVTTRDGVSTFVATPGQRETRVSPGEANAWQAFTSYARHGVLHIWEGYDHILFLLTLLLGAMARAYRSEFLPVLKEAAKVVTAFTLSHSITLGLAATGVISVPVALTESVIAATIVIAAVNNLWPILTTRTWLLALGFGLIHGLGFANVLGELGLPENSLLLSLLAFNIGVEAGQLAIVVVAVPLILWVSRTVRIPYARASANLGIAAIGVLWFTGRVLDIPILPF